MIGVRCLLTALAVFAVNFGISAQSWQGLTSSRGSLGVVVIHPHDPRVLALTWDSLVSFDSGQTWGSLGERVRNGREFAFDPSDPMLWYLITWGDEDDPEKQLVRVTWGSEPILDILADRDTFDGGIPTAVAAHPDDSKILYIGTSRGMLFRSEDQGIRWQRVLSAGTGDTDQEPFAYILLTSPSVVVASNPVDRTTFYHSSDNGATWELAGTNLGGRDLDVLAVHPEDPNLLFLSATERAMDASLPHTEVLQSSDGGTTWRTLLDASFVGVSAFAVDWENSQRLAVGVTDTVFISEDGGDSWSHISVPPSIVVPDYRPISLAFDGENRLLMSTKLGLLSLQLPLEGTLVEEESWARIKSGSR